MKSLAAVLSLVLAVSATAQHRPGFPGEFPGQPVTVGSFEVRRLADSLAYNARDAVSSAFRAGDRGRALDDLQNLSARADLFVRSLSYVDFSELSVAYNISRSGWNYLRAYRFDPRSFSALELDMARLNQSMGVVIVQPPVIIQPPVVIHPPISFEREITVTAQGSGGTEVGNIEGAKSRARERAEFAVINACRAYPHGRVVSPVRFLNTSCRKDSKKKGDYNCYTDAAVQCLVRR